MEQLDMVISIDSSSWTLHYATYDNIHCTKKQATNFCRGRRI